ncbi:hypothetical protein RXO92_29855, partial [Pseudomonas aeruginosa]|nr:hypothetical protein [Pseudomonas aeruginosa]
VMLLPVSLVLGLVARADTWRAAVAALHLNWERQQRQSAPSEVPFNQRQHQQDRFEDLVTSRPASLVWVHLALSVAAIVFGLLMAWDIDDLKWIGLWLVLPFGAVALLGSGFAWFTLNSASGKLGKVSSTLYGPAPPRVKVKNLQVQE